MRIDKFLKVSRILKRRTIAKELCDNNRILVNDKIVKPSYEVKINDIISISFTNRLIKVRVLSLEEAKRKNEAKDTYEIISDEFLGE